MLCALFLFYVLDKTVKFNYLEKRYFGITLH